MIVSLRRNLIYQIIFCVACCFTACDTDLAHFFQPASNLDGVHVVSQRYKTHPDSIRFYIARLLQTDRDTLAVDVYSRRYYANEKPFLWLNFTGIDQQTDTLRKLLADIDNIGFSLKSFYVDKVAQQIDRLHPSRIDSLQTNANEVLACVEYYLTKAYFRYAAGLRFGFVSPQYTYNHLDRKEDEGPNPPFRRLMDLPLERPTQAFFDQCATHAMSGDVASYLPSLAPQNDYYRLLLARMQVDTLSAKARQKVAINLERARWRIKNDPRQQSKYVFVNIPEFHLHAVNNAHVLSMKIGCGAYATKTPLLVSHIKRIDINPKWVIPRSIVKNEVAHHLGDSGWFARRHYIIRDHNTGRLCDPRNVSTQQLLSGNFSVAQEGGSGNALGRIIFRFDNPFAVYIHHTSSPGFFARDNRGVSHGCVRVEQPLDLAEFVLGPGHESTMERIRYSTSVDISSMNETARQHGVKPSASIDRSRMINYLDVVPRVPLYIGYYTYYPSSHRIDQAQQLQEYPDVYGYDRVLVSLMQRLHYFSN